MEADERNLVRVLQSCGLSGFARPTRQNKERESAEARAPAETIENAPGYILQLLNTAESWPSAPSRTPTHVCGNYKVHTIHTPSSTHVSVVKDTLYGVSVCRRPVFSTPLLSYAAHCRYLDGVPWTDMPAKSKADGLDFVSTQTGQATGCRFQSIREVPTRCSIRAVFAFLFDSVKDLK